MISVGHKRKWNRLNAACLLVRNNGNRFWKEFDLKEIYEMFSVTIIDETTLKRLKACKWSVLILRPWLKSYVNI